MDIQVKFIDGEAYVPLNHVVNLVVTAQNEVARSVHHHYEERERQSAIKAQAVASQANVDLAPLPGESIAAHFARTHCKQLEMSLLGQNCSQMPASENAWALGRGPSIECGDTQFIPHEQDYRGLCR